MIKHFTLLLVVSLAAGCATRQAPQPSAAIEEETPWRVGLAWPYANRGQLRAAAASTIEQCALGRVALLESAQLVEIPNGFEIRSADGKRKLVWMEIGSPPGRPAEAMLNLNWVDGVGEGGRAALLNAIDRNLRGERPC